MNNQTMKLSEVIIEKEFEPVKPSLKSGLFKEAGVGFNSSEVNQFLDSVSEEVAKMELEIEDLRNQVQVLLEERKLHSTAEQGEDEETLELKEDYKKKMKSLETLERSFKRMIYIAEKEVEKMREEAVEQAKKVIGEAQNKAESLIKEANSRYTEKEKEIEKMNTQAEEIKNKLRQVSNFIGESIS